MMNSNNSESSRQWASQRLKWQIMWQNTKNMIWMKQHIHETEHRLYINNSNIINLQSKTLTLNQRTLTKIKQTLIRTWYFSKHNGNNTLTKSRKAHSKHEKWSETEKTHTFFLKIGEEMMQKWMLFEVRHEVFEREKWGRQWTVIKIRGKNWKTILKTVFKMQNTRFSRLR